MYCLHPHISWGFASIHPSSTRAWLLLCGFERLCCDIVSLLMTLWYAWLLLLQPLRLLLQCRLHVDAWMVEPATLMKGACPSASEFMCHGHFYPSLSVIPHIFGIFQHTSGCFTSEVFLRLKIVIAFDHDSVQMSLWLCGQLLWDGKVEGCPSRNRYGRLLIS